MPSVRIGIVGATGQVGSVMRIRTIAEGIESGKKVWGLPSAWNDYSGPAGEKGETVGVALFDDPKNPHPAYWHSRDYGLMAANPFGRKKAGFPGVKEGDELVKMKKGEHMQLRYGILLHTGDVKQGKVAEYYDRFVKLRD